ncbi:hypothetical protein [Aliiglaciecola lipolytica]|uniref:Lipoprotein n=1 Tax=Aliiglaciecola lipolytica E3 TaxID=1127673 RepID=K6YC19_9ALTE|nr:hypothetical protein [Aliiglaciecola lipolytica]GAC15747.1 hypothetical protein GLIP_3126 [Aliiglaciecola lipolytica E3]
MRYLIIAVSALILTACASHKNVYQGEHLVVPSIAELKSWQLFHKEDKTYRSDMWQKRGERWADTFAVSIYYHQIADLTQKRLQMDEPGKSHCQEFQSIDMSHPKMSGQGVNFWQTRCFVGEREVARMLHLMMQGQESFYHIQKVWAFEVEESTFEQWKQRMEDTFLCDMGAQNNTCPQS